MILFNKLKKYIDNATVFPWHYITLNLLKINVSIGLSAPLILGGGKHSDLSKVGQDDQR